MHRKRRQFSSDILQSVVLILLLGLLLNGCATQQRVYYPEPAATPSPPTAPTSTTIPTPSPEAVPSPTPPIATEPAYEPTTGQAAALYSKADEALHAGQYSNAEMLLERALRIEPQNAHYWYTLAKVKYQQQQYPQTVQFCLKADSLAAGQPQLAALNRELLDNAKKELNN